MKKQTSTLRTLALCYSWAILACVPLYLIGDDSALGFGVLLRAILFLTFMYYKHNWRIFMLIVTALGVIGAMSDFTNLFFLLDMAGSAVVFMYALKERK